MRKFLLFMLILCVGFAVQSKAQATKSLEKSTYEYVYTGVSTDTVGASATTWSYTIAPQKNEALYYNHQLSLTKKTAPLSLTIKLQGKYFSTDTDYTDITTATFTNTQNDTIINFPSFTNKSGYNYYKILVTQTSGAAKITKLKAYYRK